MNQHRATLPSVTGFNPTNVVDAHMHVGEFPLFNVSMDAVELAETLRHYGIDAAMVFHPDNHYVREVVEAVDGAYGLVWCNPHIPGFVEEAVELFEHPKFLGVKMHPLLDAYHPNDPTVHPLIEELVARNLPALIHCGHPIFTLPWSIEELAVAFPAAKLILGHMGHGNIIYINGAIDVAERNENVYLETSGMPMHTKIAEAFERVGPRKVLYGSDAPFHEVGVEIRKVQVSGLGQEQIARVLEKNARLLFFGDEQATAPVPPPQRRDPG